MSPCTSILVPFDFGGPAELALDFALALASKFDAALCVLHATWLPPSAFTAYAEGLYWPTDEMAKGSKKALETIVRQARAKFARAEGLIETGEPWETILKVADTRNADLIVMGTHRRHGLSRIFLGSVAEKVVRFSLVPVLTVSQSGTAGAAL